MILLLTVLLLAWSHMLAVSRLKAARGAPDIPEFRYREIPGEERIWQGRFPIHGATFPQPGLADVFLQRVEPLEPGIGDETYRVLVQPLGLQAVDVGLHDISRYGEFNPVLSRDGIIPKFNGDGSGWESGRIEWLPAEHNLLLVSAFTYSQGSGGNNRRFDNLFLYDEEIPRALLRDELWVYSRGGWQVQSLTERQVKSEPDEFSFIDSNVREEKNVSSSPLFRQDDGDNPTYFTGLVTTKTCRIFFLDGDKFIERSRVASYRVQPGDTWEDIAEYFMKSPIGADALRVLNPQKLLDPELHADEWIVIPPEE